MIIKLAHRITDSLCSRGIVQASERDIYYFSFEVVLSAAVFWGMALVLALVSGQFIESAVYLMTFTLLRSVIGGYHASSHRKCLTLSLASLLGFLFVEIYWPQSWQQTATVCCVLYAIYAIGRFAPIDHPNNPFTDEERLRNRKRSLCYLVIFISCLLLLTAAGQRHLAFCIALGMLQAAAALNIATHYTRGGEEDEKCLVESTNSVG